MRIFSFCFTHSLPTIAARCYYKLLVLKLRERHTQLSEGVLSPFRLLLLRRGGEAAPQRARGGEEPGTHGGGHLLFLCSARLFEFDLEKELFDFAIVIVVIVYHFTLSLNYLKLKYMQIIFFLLLILKAEQLFLSL